MAIDEEHCGLALDKIPKLLEYIESKHLAPSIGPNYNYSAAEKYLKLVEEWLQKKPDKTTRDRVLADAFRLTVKAPCAAFSKQTPTKTKERAKAERLFQLARDVFSSVHGIRAALYVAEIFKYRILLNEKERVGIAKEGQMFLASAICESAENASDGQLWFQLTVLHGLSGNRGPIGSFSSLAALWRACLATSNAPDAGILRSFVTRLTPDPENALLVLFLADLKQALKGTERFVWSSLRYFQSFTARSSLTSMSEAFSMFLAFSVLRDFSMGPAAADQYDSFLDAALSAPCPAFNRQHSALIYCILSAAAAGLKLADRVWLLIMQILKSELLAAPDAAEKPCRFVQFLAGTRYSGPAKDGSLSVPALDYDLEEELSLECEQILQGIVRHFLPNGPLCKYLKFEHGTLRLGPYFAPHEEQAQPAPASVEAQKSVDLDASISELKSKLAAMSAADAEPPCADSLIFATPVFAVDTNVLLSGGSLIFTEMAAHPSHFVLPLIVLKEVAKLCTVGDRIRIANAAFSTIETLYQSGGLLILDDNGTAISPKVADESILHSLGAPSNTFTVNDNVILDIVESLRSQSSQKCPILLTDDQNMHLKSRARNIQAITSMQFRRLCHR